MKRGISKTWKSEEEENIGGGLSVLITMIVFFILGMVSFANCQDTPYPSQSYEQTYAVPQTIYQEYQQTTTITPGRQYCVPQQRMGYPGYYYYYPRPRGVWGIGPFPLGYYY